MINPFPDTKSATCFKSIVYVTGIHTKQSSAKDAYTAGTSHTEVKTSYNNICTLLRIM